MITGLSTAFATMIQSQMHVVEHRVSITLPTGPYSNFTFAAENITIEAQTVTDLPDQSRMQVGYPSMGATFTLSGLVDLTDGKKTAAWLFRRYNTASPLYRSDALMAPVTIDVGLYPASCGGVAELVRKFTGFVDSYVEMEDGSVQFTCLDNRTLLRSIPDTPAVVTAAPYSAGLTSEFALDAVLRAATARAVSSWPTQRAQCRLAVGLRSSIWPEVGTLEAVSSFPQPFVPGKFGSALNGVAIWDLATGITGADSFAEAWMQIGLTAFPSTIMLDAFPSTGRAQIDISASNAVVTVTAGASTTTYTFTGLTIDTAPHYFAWLLHWPVGSTSWSATLWIDGVSIASGTQTIGTARSTTWTRAQLAVDAAEALQVTTETSPASNYGFVPRAVLDPSLNTLEVVPAISGDPWQIIQQIADAELGVAGFDESGIFRFYNRTTIGSAPVVRDITTAETMQVETTSASVINRGQVGFTAWNYGNPAAIWQLDSVWKIPAHSTGAKKFVRYAMITDGSLFTSVDTTLTFMNNAGTTTAGLSYYRTSIDAAGSADHPGVTIVLRQTTSSHVRIEITNTTSQDCYLVASADHAAPPAGTPVLIIGGTPVTQANESTADYQYPDADSGGAASSRFGEVAWQQSGNPWIQDGDSALQLAQDVVLDGYVPRPNLTNITVIPDPRLQLIDVVHLVDPDITYVDEYARIFGWTLNLSHDSWSMTLDARSVAPPGAWILGVPGRSELAQTTYLQGV